MSANQWFKFYGGEYLSDQKIERLNPIERSCWVTLLCLASMNGSGTIKHLTVQTLLNKSGIQYDPYHPEEWEGALSILEKLESLEMIDRKDAGMITIINWSKRQETNLTVAQRVAKHREKKKSNENVTINVTNVTTEENRIEENRIDNTSTNTSKPKKASKEAMSYSQLGADIIKELESIDPKNKKYYNNKSQREACDFLIKEYTFEKVIELILWLPKLKASVPYMPSVTTPCELRDKWQKIMDAIQRHKVNKKDKIKENLENVVW